MAQDLESLRQEIFRVHGISVGVDDPIMILYTLNNQLLADGAKAQEEQLDQFKSELEGIAYQWGNEAKGKAERILNASLAASKEAMSSLMKTSAEEAARAMKVVIDREVSKAEGAARSARLVGIFNLSASVLTLLAAALVAWSAIP